MYYGYRKRSNYLYLQSEVQKIVAGGYPTRIGVPNPWKYVHRAVADARHWGTISDREARRLTRQLRIVEKLGND